MWVWIVSEINIKIDKQENDAKLLIRSCNIGRSYFTRDCKNKLI